MHTSTFMKRFFFRRSCSHGILLCIALLIVLNFTNRGKTSVLHRHSTVSHVLEHMFGNRNDDYVKELGDTKNGVYGNKNRDNSNDIINLARKVSLYNKTVLVSVVNDAYLPFAYSWLCNTKDMGVHKSVLIITTDDKSKSKLNMDWPDVAVFHMKLDIPNGDQEYSRVGYVKIMIRRTEIILSLLQANIDLFLLEFDYVWFSNPVPDLQRRAGVDMLVNPVSKSRGTLFNGGLLYLFATERSKALWTRLTEMMWQLERDIKDIPDKNAVSGDTNDQTFLSKLVRERYANITTQLLTLDIYADGQWYYMNDAKRQTLHPIVISNNWIIGNKNKIARAKRWNHWFLRPDKTCDMDNVKKIVKTEV